MNVTRVMNFIVCLSSSTPLHIYPLNHTNVRDHIAGVKPSIFLKHISHQPLDVGYQELNEKTKEIMDD